MEATTIAQNSVQATRLLNAKAREQAKADMAKETKTAKLVKEPRVTIANKWDELLTQGGTWDELLTNAQEIAKALGGTQKVSIGTLKAHCAYRIKHNAQYLKGMILSDTGIAKPTKAKKGK